MFRALLTLFPLAMCMASCVNANLEMNHRTMVADWRDEIIYQIVVDRFEDGDPNNNFNVDYRKEAAYHGGDWQGVIDRLDYIEDLGVTTLWISPVVKNVENDAGFASYHGYWTQDFTKVNPHFGDLPKLQELVRKCHDRGIKVVLDIVTNHVGQLFYYDINRNGQPDIVFYGGGGAPPGSRVDAAGNQGSELRRVSEWDPEFDYRGVQGFTSLGENGTAPIIWMEDASNNRTPARPAEFHNDAWYNRNGRVTIWEDECSCFEACDGHCGGLYTPWSSECTLSCWDYHRSQEMLGDFPGGLKDLNTQRDDVRQALIRVFQYWIEVASFDGFRIDTLKHVEPEFFDLFADAMRSHAKSLGKENFFMFGEAFDGKDFLLGRYTHGRGVDSVFYFSAKYQIFDGVFGRGGATDKVRQLYEERNKLTPKPGIVHSGDCQEGDPQCWTRYSNEPKPNGLTGGNGEPLNPQQTLVHFIDNHDVPRWLSEFPDRERLRLAIGFLLTTDGIPCIYYGTEQDFRGGPDPSNREDMWQSNFRTDGQTYQWMKTMISARKTLAPLRRGDLRFTMTSDKDVNADPIGSCGVCSNNNFLNQESCEGAGHDWGAANCENVGILAFERTYEDETVLVILNTHPTKAARTWSQGAPMQTSLGGSAELRDTLDGDFQTSTDADGGLDLELPPNSIRILTKAGD